MRKFFQVILIACLLLAPLYAMADGTSWYFTGQTNADGGMTLGST